MHSMKYLLKLVGALVLTTTVATSVAGCGVISPESVVALNQKVAQDLGLLDKEGNGTQEASIQAFDKWTIPIVTSQVTAATLLDSENKAKSKESYNFLVQTLGQKPTDEKLDGYEKDKFNKDDLEKIKGDVSAIKPTLTANSKNDYAVTAGDFKLQFKAEDDKNLGEKYLVKLKVNAEKGVVASSIAQIAKDITISDTDVTNLPINFKVGAKFPKPEDRNGIKVKLSGKSDAVRNYNNLSKLLNMEIQVLPTGYAVAGDDNWTAGDTLEIGYKIGDVTFDDRTSFQLK